MSSLSRLLPALPGFTALSHRPTPPTSPASPTAAARPPPSAAGPPPSATTTKDGRPRATDRQRGREGCPARHPPDHRQRQARRGAGDRGPDRPDGDLTEVPDGLRILIRRSKGDQEGQGAEIATPRHGNARGTAWAPAVTRAELIAEIVASNPHLRQEDAELIVATIFDQITAALARGERVELRGFGAFTMRRRNARIGRNPRTQETVQVDEKTVPYFKAGTEMLRRLNGDGMKRRT